MAAETVFGIEADSARAVTVDKAAVEAWMDWIGTLNEEHRAREAEEVMDRAIAANPDNVRLLEARAVVIRRGGELRRAEAYLLDLLPRFENAAWLHYQLGGVVSDFDRPRANVHLRRDVVVDRVGRALRSRGARW